MMEEEEDTLFDQEGLLGRKNVSTQEETQRKKKLMKTAALTMSFFSMGLCVAIAGTTLPELGRRVDKDTEHMTFILVARSIGYLIGAGLGGILSDFFDQQLILFYVLLFTSVATAAVPWCQTLFLLAVMIGVQGTAIGVLDTGGNLFCIRLWGKKSAPYMQFLHFAFGLGAFLAPLIARPFLIHSISEFSSNVSSDSVLPYPNHLNHTATGHVVVGRDLSHVVKLFEQSHDQSFGRWGRDVESDRHALQDTQKNESNIDSSNITVTPSTTITTAPSTTMRPKKPEKINSNPLRGDLADSEQINDKLKKLKNMPITDDTEAKDMKESSKTTQTSVIISSNCSDCNTTQSNQSASVINHTDESNVEVSSTSTIAATTTATSTSTAAASTSTSTTTSTTTTTTTTTTASTSTAAASSTKQQVEEGNNDNGPSLSIPIDATRHGQPHATDGSPITSTTSNTTLENRVENDLVQAMIKTLRNMSKIQFAYLIVGLFLFFNALYFVSLFYKEGIKCSQRPEPTREELIRPPDPKSFVVTILTLLFFFFYFYVGMEQTFGILLTTFAVEYPQTIWTPAQAATLTAVFWGCVALGRGISILIAHYFKAPCMMVLNLTIAVSASVILSFVLKANWIMLWLGTTLLGLGISSIFATTISWADSYYPLSGKATAVFVAGSGFGQMTIPVMTGYLYQNVNQMCLMYVVFGATCALCIIYFALQMVASFKGSSSFMRSHSGFMMLGTGDDAGDSLDMDLIQAGGMGGVMSGDRVRHRKLNGTDGDENETTQLVELSD